MCTEIASLMLIGIYFSTIEFILQSSHILDTTIAKIWKKIKKSQKCQTFGGKHWSSKKWIKSRKLFKN